MNAYEQLIRAFYSAFQNRDFKAMQDCYHPGVHFSDPVFPALHGKEAWAMWHMLCEQSRDLLIDFDGIKADENGGEARWRARYTFGKQGRKVTNEIEARFQFEDGRIAWHEDRFNMWKWSGMALGLPGRLLGWSPFMQGKIRNQAARSLRKFITGHPEYR